MLSKTRRALEDFDNQHDFERMGADILNALGYSGVEPMAPGGGPDCGKDIKFREGETPGIAFVSLEKKIQDKFKRDLEKLNNNDDGEIIALFCNVVVTPKTKLDFTKMAISKECRLEVFDLERIRSLLDSSLKDVRRRYLNIDDDVAALIRSEVRKLLRFPEAIADSSTPRTVVEKMLANKMPQRLFDLLMRYEENDVLEVPNIGKELHTHMIEYYKFRELVLRIEPYLFEKIGKIVNVSFRKGWEIYYKYAIMRFGGLPQEAIIAGGNFLNYDINWIDAERA